MIYSNFGPISPANQQNASTAKSLVRMATKFEDPYNSSIYTSEDDMSEKPISNQKTKPDFAYN